MIQESVRKKIENLISRSSELVSADIMQRDYPFLASCQGWTVESLNAIELAVPIEDNPYRRKIRTLAGETGINIERIREMAVILQAVLSDIDAGLVADFGNAIRAETFDDFLDHADTYQQSGQKQAAGVLAGVVFEDTIRRICRDKGITDKGKKLEDLINELARQGTLTPLQSKQAKVASHVRTKATHAQWDEFDLDSVLATIQTTRRLLQEHLSG
jgi:hypothetical protein